MTIETKVTCNNCSKSIDGHWLTLQEHEPSVEPGVATFDICLPPLIDMHFCGKECLKGWLK